jgi:hypothetical protein
MAIDRAMRDEEREKSKIYAIRVLIEQESKRKEGARRASQPFGLAKYVDWGMR